MTATGHPGRIDGLRGAIKNGLMTSLGSALVRVQSASGPMVQRGDGRGARAPRP